MHARLANVRQTKDNLQPKPGSEPKLWHVHVTVHDFTLDFRILFIDYKYRPFQCDILAISISISIYRQQKLIVRSLLTSSKISQTDEHKQKVASLSMLCAFFVVSTLFCLSVLFGTLCICFANQSFNFLIFSNFSEKSIYTPLIVTFDQRSFAH